MRQSSIARRRHPNASSARRRSSLFLALGAALLLLAAFASLPAEARRRGKQPKKTHYDVLEIQPAASLKDVKKAYRKLAVRHHPDRNLGNEEAATIKFREISEAYEVLSDEDSRREYDRALKGGFGFGHGGNGGNGNGGNGNGGGGAGFGGGDYRGRQQQQQQQRRQHYRDPFAQFNDVFKNDPFFKEAAKNMDDLFNQHFANNDGGRTTRTTTSNSNRKNKNGVKKEEEGEGGGSSWVWNKVKDYMPNINIEVQTSSSANGRHSSTSRSYGSSSRRRSGSSSTVSSSSSSSSSTYTSRSTRTVMQNGQRVTIQSLEKDGNKIEERYVGERLIERKINGMVEDNNSGGRISGRHGEF